MTLTKEKIDALIAALERGHYVGPPLPDELVKPFACAPDIGRIVGDLTPAGRLLAEAHRELREVIKDRDTWAHLYAGNIGK